MMANLMKLLGISSEQAAEPELYYECQPIGCSSTRTHMKVYCDGSAPYCDILSSNCC